MWTGRHVVLGVSGGIACYKSCMLARRLAEAGALVDVGAHARRRRVRAAAHLRGAHRAPRPLLPLGAAAGRSRMSGWDRQADLVIVAPATAHLIARMAQGLADDLLTTLLLAATAPVLLAPAMNDEMYAHAQTQANLDRLRARGVALGRPRDRRAGRRPVRATRPHERARDDPGARRAPAPAAAAALRGRRVVVTAGPTRESIDPVRVVTNRSSGKMGYAVAEVAWERGADVVLISGPVALAPPVGVTVRRVETTKQLEAAVREELADADVLVMAAAPADFRPSDPSDRKRARIDGALAIPWSRRTTSSPRTRGARVGPGASSSALRSRPATRWPRAERSSSARTLDLIVVNDALEPGAGFEVDTNRVALARPGRAPHAFSHSSPSMRWPRRFSMPWSETLG